MKWEHKSIVLRFTSKVPQDSGSDFLQGLDEESYKVLQEAGVSGWEMVSVVPLSAGAFSASGKGIFSASQSHTNAVIAFFKRLVEKTT